jgi:hypothetical protein
MWIAGTMPAGRIVQNAEAAFQKKATSGQIFGVKAA